MVNSAKIKKKKKFKLIRNRVIIGISIVLVIVLLVFIFYMLVEFSAKTDVEKKLDEYKNPERPAEETNTVNEDINTIVNEQKNDNTKDEPTKEQEQAISNGLIKFLENTDYLNSEYQLTLVRAEAHKTLRTEEENGTMKAYVTAAVANYALDNGKYEQQSGLAAPMVLEFNVNDEEYTFKSCTAPDQNNWEASIKTMFPEDLVVQASTSVVNDASFKKQIDSHLIAADYSKLIDKSAIESITKQGIRDFFSQTSDLILSTDDIIVAEGHKNLRVTDINDSIIHIYTKALIRQCIKKVDGSYTVEKEIATPLTITVEMNNYGILKVKEVKYPEQGKNFRSDLEKIFPEDLVDKAISADYNGKDFEEQIQSYLN